ncbi:hypothetical protein [Levilactobacillus suantsaiihabitans]|uniref:DUF4760 domain-containing protein n=1 Tax=Levilactobacillus suantsaiihabitans TaxID=2487722 RepID=A0A4Z0JA05_9LACO|nr:hypothetical protein [Levilactobacillus suantsaiihabitans]TGD18588.1 hypothetical protein EGT51_08015 [Levilactobacillus suantsaiihabitans]
MAFWLTLAPLLAPVVSVATIGGIVIALIQLQVVLRNRRIDLAATRFDHTIQAYEFYQNNVAEILDGTIAQYEAALQVNDFQKKKDEHVRQSIMIQAMVVADFGTCFQRLNILESYVYYDEIDKYQLYSSIGDSIYELIQLDGFAFVQDHFLKEQVMNNYVNLLNDIQLYVQKRRQKNDSKD